MRADERDEVGGDVKELKKIPERIYCSNFHLIIQEEEHGKIYEEEDVCQHRDYIAEPHPFDPMTFIIVIIGFHILQRSLVRPVKMNDEAYPLNQEYYRSENTGY